MILGRCNRPLDRPDMPGDHHLSRIIVIGHGTNLALGRFIGQCRGLFDVGSEQGRHAALADRHRLLHRQAAQFQQFGGRRQVQGPRRAQRAIFAEAVAGDIAAQIFQRLAAVFFHDPQGRDGIGHDRRLRIFGQGQFFGRAFAHQLEQILLQRVIDFLENFAGGAAGLGKRLAHADRLAALSRKNKCAHDHPHCKICWGIRDDCPVMQAPLSHSKSIAYF